MSSNYKKAKPTRYKGIRRLLDGRVVVRARVTDPKTGKRRESEQTVEGIEPTDAVGLQREMCRELLSSRTPSTPTTLLVCGGDWLEAERDRHCAQSTLDHRMQVMEGHLLPVLGEHRVHLLEPSDFKAWLKAVSNKRIPSHDKDGRLRAGAGEFYGVETVKGWWRVTQALVRWIVNEEHYGLDYDPTAGIVFERVVNLELRRDVQAQKGTNSITPEELPLFLEVALKLYPQHFAMIVVGLFTGMRWSELSALRWDHFDHETMLIRIYETQWSGNFRKKTKGKPRGPAFNEEMWRILSEHRQRMMREQHPGLHSGLVFPNAAGRPHYASLLTKPFVRICKEAKIPKTLTTKVFRRTYRDLARKAEVDAIVKNASVGHIDDLRMAQHYDSVAPEEKRQALAKIVNHLGGNE